jgi:hypothetical protein
MSSAAEKRNAPEFSNKLRHRRRPAIPVLLALKKHPSLSVWMGLYAD